MVQNDEVKEATAAHFCPLANIDNDVSSKRKGLLNTDMMNTKPCPDVLKNLMRRTFRSQGDYSVRAFVTISPLKKATTLFIPSDCNN